MSEIDKQLNSREVIERKRKAFEEKYGDKLQKRVERYVTIMLLDGSEPLMT